MGKSRAISIDALILTLYNIKLDKNASHVEIEVESPKEVSFYPIRYVDEDISYNNDVEKIVQDIMFTKN